MFRPTYLKLQVIAHRVFKGKKRGCRNNTATHYVKTYILNESYHSTESQHAM